MIDNLKKINYLSSFIYCGSFIVKILKRTAEFKVDENDNHLNDGAGNFCRLNCKYIRNRKFSSNKQFMSVIMHQVRNALLLVNIN